MQPTHSSAKARPGTPVPLQRAYDADSIVLVTPDQAGLHLRLPFNEHDLRVLGKEPPKELLKRGRRVLYFPVPAMSCRLLAEAFSDRTHHPILEVSPGHKDQEWFNRLYGPAWIRSDLILTANDGQEESGREPNAAELAALVLMTQALGLPPTKHGFVKLASNTPTDDGYRICVNLHAQRLRHLNVSVREARLTATVKITAAYV